MNAVKPLVRDCTSRTRSRCSMRSASVSPMPYIMVTDVFIPSWCAISMISSQRSAPAFLRATWSRTRWTRISPPPPGMESSPAFISSRITSRASMPEQLGEEIHFARAEAVDVDRVVPLDVAQQVEVPLERDVRVVPALDEDLHAAEGLGLLDLGADLLVRQRPAFAVLGAAVERAEPAVGDADVGVVDVAVDDVGDDAVGVLLAPHAVGFGAEFEQRGVRVEVEERLHAARSAAGRRYDGSTVHADQAAGRKRQPTADATFARQREPAEELRQAGQVRIATGRSRGRCRYSRHSAAATPVASERLRGERRRGAASPQSRTLDEARRARPERLLHVGGALRHPDGEHERQPGPPLPLGAQVVDVR